MRPKSIVWFERLSLAAVIAGALNALTVAETGLAATWADDGNAAVVFFGSVIVVLALVYRVSRWRSRAAKWILIVFTLMLLIGSAPLLLARMDWARTLVGLAACLIQLGALALLFTPSARAWLAANARPREMLERTFG